MANFSLVYIIGEAANVQKIEMVKLYKELVLFCFYVFRLGKEFLDGGGALNVKI